MKITIAGTCYVRLSNAIILAQHNEVIALDIITDKVDMINNRKTPIVDTEIEEYLATKELNLKATTDSFKAFKDESMSLSQHLQTMIQKRITSIQELSKQ